MTDSIKQNSIVGESEILLNTISPYIYRENAFRITQLPVDATPRDIAKNVKKAEMMKKYGGAAQQVKGSLLIKPPPDKDAIRGAMQNLRDPERRIIDEFFWFWPDRLKGKNNDPAFKAFNNRRVNDATKIWTKKAESGKNAGIAAHNLAVVYHLSALDLEVQNEREVLNEKNAKKRDICWVKAFNHWKTVLEDEDFWSSVTDRIREYDDPRLTTGMSRRMRQSLPLALLTINAELAVKAAEKQNHPDLKRHVARVKDSGFDDGIIDEALKKAMAPLRKRVSALCKSKATDDEKPENGYENATQLLEQSKKVLSVFDAVLPGDHPIREGAHDEVALTVLLNVIGYANETAEWKKSLAVLKKSFQLAKSESLQKRIQENTDIFSKNIEYNQLHNICFFCKKNNSDEDAVIKHEMHGDIVRDDSGIKWQKATIEVPRCNTCKKTHDFDLFSGIIGILLYSTIIGIILDIPYAFIITDINPFTSWGWLYYLPIFISITFGIIYSFYRAIKRSKIKQKNKYIEFPHIQELIAKGWERGSEPANKEHRICFFCGKNWGDETAVIKHEMYGEVVKGYSSITGYSIIKDYLNKGCPNIKWKHLTVEVPRCKSCKKAHIPTENFGCFMMLGIFLGIVCLYKYWETDKEWWELALYFLFSSFIGGVADVICNSIKKSKKSSLTIRPIELYEFYPRILELKAMGWKNGVRPPEADQLKKR